MALALTAGVAQGAAEPHPHVGKLPGYPVIRGAVPVLGSKAAVSAHEKLVAKAFALARSRHTLGSRLLGLKGVAVPNEIGERECSSAIEEEIVFETQNMCYRGGPVVRDPKIHLIFWQGKPGAVGEENVQAFPVGYESTVTKYFEDVALESNRQTNVFAVEPQYGDVTESGFVAGEYALREEVEVIHDTSTFLPSTCTDSSTFAEGPCVLDKNLQNEVKKYSGPPGLGDIYVVLTPKGVGGCFEEGVCAYQAYCAYHGDFGGEGVVPGEQTLYADLPFVGKFGGCDSGVHPNSATDDGADAVIDDASHEINETISDPLGSQCAEGATEPSECEPNAWTDAIGQEVGDKCLPPEETVAGIYGPSLVAGLGVLSFNQEINSHRYYTQREWSNEAGVFEGGCVQRAINASFTVSAGAQATVPMTLDGSASGAPGDPATYWVWDILNTGEQFGAASPTISHAFAQAGQQIVALTAYDRYGNSEAIEESFIVGPAPTPPAPTAPNVITIKEPITPGHLTAGQMATKLGLRVTKLFGKGPFSLGRAECPPACGVTLQLYAKAPTAPGSRHSIKLLLIGSAHLTLAAKGAKKLVLSLNAKGRALLRANRSLRCRLVVTVEGQEGGTWQIVRLLTLTH
jgi:hypothetical protein